MSALTDFSFKNPNIKDYFDGKIDQPPTGELIYIHSHPLVKPNFLAELDTLVVETTNVMIARKYNGPLVSKLTELTKELGVQLPEIDKNNAAKVLATLKSIYTICNQIIAKR